MSGDQIFVDIEGFLSFAGPDYDRDRPSAEPEQWSVTVDTVYQWNILWCFGHLLSPARRRSLVTVSRALRWGVRSSLCHDGGKRCDSSWLIPRLVGLWRM